MAITPAPGYIVDPSNPNAVIKDPGTSTSLGGMGGGSTSYGAVNQPVATAPVTPAPQIQSPSAPQTKNFTTPSGAQVQAPAAQNVPASGTQMGGQPQAGLTMPATGSVVDLLNMAGQDSSFQARQQLAQQFGIQGYTGTASQNQELSKKYLEAYNAKKSTAPPTSGAQAASELDQYFSNEQQQPTTDPVKGFMDVFSSMNPIEANLYNQLSQYLSTPFTKQSMVDFYKQEVAAQGIEGLNLELADLNRIMDGTEDDIRAEITAAGGFATESQVQGLTAARNKVLLRKANYLQDVVNAKNDYVDRIVSLTQADREEVSKELDRKLGITTTLFTMSQQMRNAERENLTTLVSQIGYNGLAELVRNSPNQQANVEKTLGLPKGTLSNPAFLELAKPKPKLTTQVIEVDGRKALVSWDDKGNPVNAVDLGSAATAGSGGLTPGQVNAFNSIVSKYNASPLIAAADRTIVLKNTIDNIRKDPGNGAQQLNLAYSYIQALDTYQSAVREGELSLVNSIDSRIGQVKGEIERIQNGQIVRPEVALQIAAAAENIVDTINEAARVKAQSFASQANVVGLGPYWNQYVTGFSQSYNQIPTIAKGTLPDNQFVEKVLTDKGVSYQRILEDIPLGQIGVIDNDTGEIGSIPAEEFDPSIYTRI